AGCQKPAPAKGAKNPRVVVTQPITDTVIDFQDFTGRLDAVRSVEVRARATGYVTEAPFKEGDFVKEGTLLFQIDKRTYQADYNPAEANLKVAVADRNFQEKNAARAQRLQNTSAVSREDYETATAASEKANATVGAMEAARDRARLYLDYTGVTAPVS